MKVMIIIARVLLGAMFLFASITYFLHIMPGGAPKLSPDQAKFMTGVMATKYLMTLIKITELVCGTLLLIRRTAALATIIILPVMINIFLYSVFLSQKDLPMVGLMLIFNLFLIYAYRRKYLPILAK